jgi:hypothetical protein
VAKPLKAPKGYVAYTPEESRVLLSSLNMSILTLDHFSFILEALDLAEPQHVNRLERAVRNLKKLRRKLGGANPYAAARAPKKKRAEDEAKKK